MVLSDPRLKGNDLAYHVELLEGKIPATAGISTLFIDSAVRRIARRTSRETPADMIESETSMEGDFRYEGKT